MKNLMTIFASVVLLAGCASNTSESSFNNVQQKEDNEEISAVTIEKTDRAGNNVNNPQAPATDTLQEIGQEFTDEDGKVILEAISEHHSTNKIGPVELKIKDVKVMNYTPTLHLIDFFNGFTQNESNFNYVKLNVTIKNTSDLKVDFAPVSFLETSEGEQKGFEDDFYLQNLYGELYPNEEKSGELAFILDRTNLKDLSFITIVTSDVFNIEKESITKGKSIRIEF